MFKKIFLKKRNVFIILLGLIFTYGYFNIFGFNAKPIIFISIVLVISFLYSGIFDVYLKNLDKRIKELQKSKVNLQNIDSYADMIELCIKRIKEKAKGKTKFLFISKFMDEIVEIEQILPKLVENYKRGQNYLANNNVKVNEEIKKLEKKLENVKGKAKETYNKALQAKFVTLREFDNIKSSMDEAESKLSYILSTLQKIETSMESYEVGEALSDEETTNFTIEFEAFTEVLKETKKGLRV